MIEDTETEVVALPKPCSPDKLAHHYLWPISKFIARHVRNYADVEDITADVFATAFKNLGEDRSLATSIRPDLWLFRLAANRIASYYRSKKRREVSWSCYQDEEALLNESVDPGLVSRFSGELEVRIITVCDVLAALGRLPENKRDVLLCWSQGHSYGDIARMRRTTEGAIVGLWQRAVADMRRQLLGQEIEAARNDR